MPAGPGSFPPPWHRASFPADLFPQSQPHRAALEVRQKTVPLFDLLQRLRRLQTGHLRLPCSNQHRPQGHSRFPPHPPFPDILKITDREEVKYSSTTPFMASSAFSFEIIPSSTRMCRMLSHNIRLTWPSGSGTGISPSSVIGVRSPCRMRRSGSERTHPDN